MIVNSTYSICSIILLCLLFFIDKAWIRRPFSGNWWVVLQLCAGLFYFLFTVLFFALHNHPFLFVLFSIISAIGIAIFGIMKRNIYSSQTCLFITNYKEILYFPSDYAAKVKERIFSNQGKIQINNSFLNTNITIVTAGNIPVFNLQTCADVCKICFLQHSDTTPSLCSLVQFTKEYTSSTIKRGAPVRKPTPNYFDEWYFKLCLVAWLPVCFLVLDIPILLYAGFFCSLLGIISFFLFIKIYWNPIISNSSFDQ